MAGENNSDELEQLLKEKYPEFEEMAKNGCLKEGSRSSIEALATIMRDPDLSKNLLNVREHIQPDGYIYDENVLTHFAATKAALALGGGEKMNIESLDVPSRVSPEELGELSAQWLDKAAENMPQQEQCKGR